MIIELDYEDALRLRDHLRDCRYTGDLGGVGLEINQAIQNEDEARAVHLEERKLL